MKISFTDSVPASATSNFHPILEYFFMESLTVNDLFEKWISEVNNVTQLGVAL